LSIAIGMLTLIAATATLSGLVAGFLPTIQIRKIVRSRTSHGISIPFVAGGVVNNLVWSVYAFAFPSIALVVPNVLALLMNGTMLVVAVRYRPRSVRRLLAVAPTAEPAARDEEHVQQLAA
jgi:uncharacterized protein with PQ loop repeat